MRDIGGGALSLPVNFPSAFGPSAALTRILHSEQRPACVVPKVLSRLAAQRVSRESRARHPTSGTLAAQSECRRGPGADRAHAQDHTPEAGGSPDRHIGILISLSRIKSRSHRAPTAM